MDETPIGPEITPISGQRGFLFRHPLEGIEKRIPACRFQGSRERHICSSFLDRGLYQIPGNER